VDSTQNSENIINPLPLTLPNGKKEGKMYVNEGEFNRIIKELQELMKDKSVDKIRSLIYSLYRANEDLKKSRDKWREKCNLMIGNKKS